MLKVQQKDKGNPSDTISLLTFANWARQSLLLQGFLFHRLVYLNLSENNDGVAHGILGKII